jgi:hypothetical protein
MNRNKFIAVIIVIILVSVFFKKQVLTRLFGDYDNEHEKTNTEYFYDSENYPDDTYCAEVEYYNPNTGTRSTYTLNVEVENNELTVIHWPNGGWLDDSHFEPQELDSSGNCSFTSDNGYEYDIHITGPECNFTDEDQMNREISEDQALLVCPECGFSKYEYDDYCYSCKRKMTCPECGSRKNKYEEVCSSCKDKAEHTCKRCGQHDSFMWSSDDLCSDCKRDDEDQKRQEEENNN